MAKSFPDKMSKNVHICNWISFAISTFIIIEKMPSGIILILPHLKIFNNTYRIYILLAKLSVKIDNKLAFVHHSLHMSRFSSM